MQRTIDSTSTVYMDGSAVYSIREAGKAGVLFTLRLFRDDYQTLVDHGVFEERS